MAVDLSSRIAQIMAGQRRVRPLPTLAIALAVTALVAIPLTERVIRADSASPAADPTSIIVDLLDADPSPLDGATVNGAALISLNDDNARAVSFAFFAAGETDPVLASQDLAGPSFTPLRTGSGTPQSMDTTVLDNGPYELFVTVATDDGEQRTAVTFEIENP